MSTGRGLLAVWMQIPERMEEEFTAWYNDEHVPERLGVPGFFGARRYLSLQGYPKFAALYPLEDLAVLSSDDYLKLRRGGSTPWTRRIGRNLEKNIRHEYELLAAYGTPAEAAAPNVLLVRFGSDPDREEAFVKWYQGEYLPALARVPGVQEAKLYQATVGTPKYLAVIELDSAGAPESAAWKDASGSAEAKQMLSLLRDVETNLGQLILAAP